MDLGSLMKKNSQELEKSIFTFNSLKDKNDIEI